MKTAIELLWCVIGACCWVVFVQVIQFSGDPMPAFSWSDSIFDWYHWNPIEEGELLFHFIFSLIVN